MEALWRDCFLDFNCPLKRSCTWLNILFFPPFRDAVLIFVNYSLHQAGSKSRQSLVGEVWGEEGGSSFPLSCLALREDNAFCQLTVWTYSSLSGLLLLDKEGRVSLASEGSGRR